MMHECNLSRIYMKSSKQYYHAINYFIKSIPTFSRLYNLMNRNFLSIKEVLVMGIRYIHNL